jgi:hypothetical protein
MDSHCALHIHSTVFPNTIEFRVRPRLLRWNANSTQKHGEQEGKAVCDRESKLAIRDNQGSSIEHALADWCYREI